MTKFSADTIKRWEQMASDWLAANTSIGVGDILTGRDAWTVAHRCGITNEAYKDRSVIDAHIQTALQSIFPNAEFKDKKRY
jgi:hypothetical protein